MPPARVLFVAEAVTLAHVGRLVALAKNLDRTRFTPLFAWHPRFNKILGDLGGDYYPLHSITTEQFLSRLLSARPVYDFSTLETYAAWEIEIFREAQPDLVVGDFRLSLLISTRIVDLPYVNVVNAHWSPYARPRFRVPESPVTRVFGPAIAQSAFDLLRPIFFRSFAQGFNRLVEKFGRPGFGPDLRAIYCGGDWTLYPDLAEVTPTVGLPPHHRYLGPITWSPPDLSHALLDAIPADRPLVYVNLGSSGRESLLPRIFRVLGQFPVRVIAATGGRIRLGHVPGNVTLTDFLPGEAACRRADLMICNGGVASAQQALVAGAPVLGLASNMDQMLYMDFAERAGIGRLVRADAASEALLERAIRDLLINPSYRAQAKALAVRAAAYEPGRVLNETLSDALVGRALRPIPGTTRPPSRPAQKDARPIETPEQAHELARAALVAPSVGNCQPWRFAWDGDSLEIFVDPMRANPFLDFINDDICTALGAAWTNMEAAAARMGRGLWVDVFPEDARNGLWARVRLTDTPGPEAPLAEALHLRHTNRRAYHAIPLTDGDRLALRQWADLPGVRLDLVEGPARVAQAADAMAIFNQVLVENLGIRQSITHWVRMDEDAEFARRDGLGLRSLELGPLGRLILRLGKSRVGPRLLTSLGLSNLFRFFSRRTFARSAAVGVITMDRMGTWEFVQAGRSLERLWLEAARRGLALQPIGGLLLLEYRMRFVGGAGLSPHEKRLALDARQRMASVAPAFLERVPAILFRVGRAAPASARSLRLPLESVFLDTRAGTGALIPAAAPVRRVPVGPGPRPSTKRRVLFLAEGVTVTHIGRLFYLARRLNRDRFIPLLAWHPRYNSLLGPLSEEFFPLYSLPTSTFLDRLYRGKPVYDFETLERYVTWDLEIFRESRPDVVVGDYRLSLGTSTQFAGIPYINVINAHWSPYAHPRFHVPEIPLTHRFGPRLCQAAFDVLRPLLFHSFAQDFNQLNRKFGRPDFGHDLRAIYCYGDRTLYPDIPEIVPVEGLPPNHRFMGPVVWSPDLPVPAELSHSADGRKTVYVNLGTSGRASLVPPIVDALLRRGLKVIAATGPLPVPVPASPDVFVAPYVPGDAACRASDLVIFNGGSAGGHQALLAGVPVLGIPSNMDQHLNMHFLEKAGLGQTIRAESVTVERVGRAVDELLRDSRPRERARELAERAGTYAPVRVLEETLDEVLAGRPPVAPPLPSAPFLKGITPSADLLKEVVRAGGLAPSAANSQPFRWSWDGERLAVHVAPDRANPFLNFMNPDTWISLGSVLVNMQVTTAARGFRLRTELALEGTKEGVVAYAAFDPGTAPGAELAAQVEPRCTNRRDYADRPIPADARAALLNTMAAFGPIVRLDWVEDATHRREMAKALTVFNRMLFENRGLLSSFLEWLRTTPEATERTRDGLSLESLELGRVGEWLFRLGASQKRAAFLAPTGLFRLFAWGSSRRTAHTPAFGMLSVPLNDVASYVQVGSALETLWLKATELGLTMHPLGGALTLMTRVRFTGGAGLSREERRLANRAMVTLGRILPSFDTRLPALFFRIGQAPAPTARSLRLPLDEVFEDRTRTTKIQNPGRV